MTTRTLLFGIFFLAQLLVFGPNNQSFADGNTITRPATAEEKEFILKTKQALKAALPAVPSGWVTDHESPLVAEDTVSFPGKEAPLEIESSADLRRVEGMEERAAARDKAAVDSTAARSKMNQLTDAIREKINQADKARSDGDRSLYEKAKADMEALQKEYDTLMESPENPVKLVNDAELNLQRDTTIRMKAETNSRYAGISGPLQPLQVPNALAAFRRDFEDRTRNSKALVLFGDWKLEKFGEGQNQSVSARRIPANADKVTAVYTVVLEFEADKERISELVGAINSAALAGLISAPPQ